MIRLWSRAIIFELYVSKFCRAHFKRRLWVWISSQSFLTIFWKDWIQSRCSRFVQSYLTWKSHFELESPPVNSIVSFRGHVSILKCWMRTTFCHQQHPRIKCHPSIQDRCSDDIFFCIKGCPIMGRFRNSSQDMVDNHLALTTKPLEAASSFKEFQTNNLPLLWDFFSPIENSSGSKKHCKTDYFYRYTNRFPDAYRSLEGWKWIAAQVKRHMVTHSPAIVNFIAIDRLGGISPTAFNDPLHLCLTLILQTKGQEHEASKKSDSFGYLRYEESKAFNL